MKRVFTNVDALDAKKAELKVNEALTEIGKQRAALDFGFSLIMPDVLGQGARFPRRHRKRRPGAASCSSRVRPQ